MNPRSFTVSVGIAVLAAQLMAQAPSNDTPAGAQNISLSGVFVGTTTNATPSTGVTNCASFGPGTADVWYVIQPVANGPCVAETCEPGSATFDTMIAVYIVSPSGTLVACNDDTCGLSSHVAFTATAGLPFFIRVGGYGGATGDFALSVTMPGPPPPNDSCAAAIPITGPEIPGTTYGAALDPFETPGLCSPADRNVWYTWTNPYGCPMAMTASLCTFEAGGAGFDSVIGIWHGTCGSLTSLACNDDDCGLRSRVQFVTAPYETVYVSIGVYSNGSGPAPIGGNFVLTFYGDSGQVTVLGAGCALTPGGPTPGLNSLHVNIGFNAYMYLGGATPGSDVALYVSAPNGAPFNVTPTCTVFLDLATAAPFWSGTADVNGNWDLALAIPSIPALVCLEVTFQALVSDASGAGLSNGLLTRVGYLLY